MRKLIAYQQLSLDGFFTDAHGDMSWAHQHDAEWSAYTAQNAGGTSVMVFGRKTYEMMASFWPTAEARAMNAAVAEHMNGQEKVVFSRTLASPSWANTTVRRGDVAGEVRRLKTEDGPDLLVMGSGSLMAPLVDGGLVDVLTVVIVPVILGGGRSLFAGTQGLHRLERTSARPFSNGNVVLTYGPRA